MSDTIIAIFIGTGFISLILLYAFFSLLYYIKKNTDRIADAIEEFSERK
jgi:hypothetical protein